jgi:hypothetical protein
MIEISLSTGDVALIDDVDAELAQLHWWLNSRGYVTAKTHSPWGRRLIRLHRAVMERAIGRRLPSSVDVDHIDGEPLNNTRDNLRMATRQQNQANRDASRGRPYKGVYRSQTPRAALGSKDHRRRRAEVPGQLLDARGSRPRLQPRLPRAFRRVRPPESDRRTAVSIFMKTKTSRATSRAPLRSCRQVMTTTSERDAALMNRHPQDGRWLCRTLYRKEGAAMSGYVVDGKGNVYAAETGTLVWSGDPADVLTLLMQLDQLRATRMRACSVWSRSAKRLRSTASCWPWNMEALRDELCNANAHR